MASSFKGLKREVECLKQTFPKTHEVFCINAASVDDLSCTFIWSESERHSICCNIGGMYPDTPPMWFTESEDSRIMDVIENANEVKADSNLLLAMTKYMVAELYKIKNIPLPSTVEHLTDIQPDEAVASSSSFNSDSDMEDLTDFIDEDEGIDEDQDEFNMDSQLNFEEEGPSEEVKEKQEMGSENFEVMKKLKLTQRQEYLKGSVSGSVQATDRLMKELKNIYKSDSFKSNLYTVELASESNLYDWNVKFKGFDKESQLYKDLQQLYKKDNKTDHVCLNITYKERFPMEPPFVRIVYPVIVGGYVLTGGAICMELLTTQGWSSAYSIEALIMQISATLVKGKARVDFTTTERCHLFYTLNKAQSAYKTLVSIHEKKGWFTPPKGEG